MNSEKNKSFRKQKTTKVNNQTNDLVPEKAFVHEKSGFSSYQFDRNSGRVKGAADRQGNHSHQVPAEQISHTYLSGQNSGDFGDKIIVDTSAKQVTGQVSYASLLKQKSILTGDKQINHDNSLAELPALDSNRPRDEWNLSHVRIEDISPQNAAK